MTPTRCETDLLCRLAETPFADRLDLAALSGWSRGAVYAGMDDAHGTGDGRRHPPRYAPAAIHQAGTASPLTASTRPGRVGRRWLWKICSAPASVSAQLQRLLLERLDALAVIYRLAAAVSNAAFPTGIRLFRAAPVDAGFVLPGGRIVAVVRQGNTADRTGFSKRLWRLREGPLPGGVLVLSPDEVRLRQARRMLAGARFPVFLALEKDAALAGLDSPVWHPPSIAAGLDLRYVLARLDRRGGLPVEAQPARVALPADINLDAPAPDWLLPALITPAEKRALDLLSDWPWASRRDLAELMGVSVRRVSQLTERLEEFGLLSHANAQGTRRLALLDRALALLARRDRTSVGTAQRRWSVAPLDSVAPRTWRNISGSRSRQLLRNVEHTGAVHWFLGSLAGEARAAGWEVVQLDPPGRASRYFPNDGRLHSVRPDASGVLRRGGETVPFFLEWERRAVRPVTMATRLAPYLRYYSTRRPLDDHGVTPIVLVVFDDELAASHFLRVARQEMERAGVEVPLWVSNKAVLERLGPMGRAWQCPSVESQATPFRL